MTTQPEPLTYEELAEQELDGSLCMRLQREMIDVEVVARFTVEGEPVSKHRPRFAKSRGRVYTPGGTVVAERAVAWSFRQAVGPFEPPSDQGFGVFLGFFCGTGQRRDVDNMTKLILDGLNKVAWKDDSQVTEISAKVLRWQPDPRAEVVIYKTMMMTHPTRNCENCGKSFKDYPSSQYRRCCSRKCSEATRGARTGVCAHCGKSFEGKPSAIARSKHCSPECRRASEAKELVHRTCGFCGKEFTLRPSEARQRPNRKYCSIECRRQGGRSRPAA